MHPTIALALVAGRMIRYCYLPNRIGIIEVGLCQEWLFAKFGASYIYGFWSTSGAEGDATMRMIYSLGTYDQKVRWLAGCADGEAADRCFFGQHEPTRSV